MSTIAQNNMSAWSLPCSSHVSIPPQFSYFIPIAQDKLFPCKPLPILPRLNALTNEIGAWTYFLIVKVVADCVWHTASKKVGGGRYLPSLWQYFAGLSGLIVWNNEKMGILEGKAVETHTPTTCITPTQYSAKDFIRRTRFGRIKL